MTDTQRPSAVRRVRRRVARWLAPELEAELRDTRRKLKAARAKLRETRGAYTLPPEVEETIARVRAEHLTFLKPDHLRDIAQAVVELEDRRLPGLLVEAGTARGGSAIVIASCRNRFT